MNLDRQNIQIVNFDDAAAKSAFVRRISALTGKFSVRMTKYRARRSGQQNRFYWGIILPCICDGIAEAWGEPITADEVHLLLKQMFLSRPVVNHQTGQEMARVWPSSASLNVADFSAYIEKIAKFAAESLGVVLPESSGALTKEF